MTRLHQRKLGTLEDRLMAKMRIEDRGYITPCWIWTGATDQKGYGRISVRNINERVHIVSARLFLPDFSRHLQSCHKCDVKPCFRPDHLFMGTNRDNQIDLVLKGKHHNASKTHCKHGHPFAGDNLKIENGKRVCLTCKRSRT